MAATYGSTPFVFGCPEETVTAIRGIPPGLKARMRLRPEEFASVFVRYPDGSTKHFYLLKTEESGVYAIDNEFCVGGNITLPDDIGSPERLSDALGLPPSKILRRITRA